MTQQEYHDKLREILKPFDCVPYIRDFMSSYDIRDFMSSYAYENGHSCGYEEVIIHATNIAYDLKEALIKDGIIDGHGNRRNYFPAM